MDKDKDFIPIGEGGGDENDYDCIEVTNPGFPQEQKPKEIQGYNNIVEKLFKTIEELNEAIAVLNGQKGLHDFKHLNQEQQLFLKMLFKTYELSGERDEIDSAKNSLGQLILKIFQQMESEETDEETGLD
ncbi:hypothetical protein JW911_01745 [Candidatus Peregrinibacteria bacterium]|nr:hypothetical protein [Candidatus Peregrinibacteria bacterium]